MLKKMAEYLGAQPSRAAMIVMTLVVILILVVAGSLFQSLNLASYLESPYPSEETPLSLLDNGIRWDNPIMFQDANYSGCKFLWGNESGSCTGHVAFESQQAQLSSGSAATVVMTVAQAADLSYWVNLTIHDSTGDGNPGFGDYIIFSGAPQQSDTVYTLSLVYLADGGGGTWSEFSYAIHNGNFYSWVSDTAGTVPPWWWY